MKDKQWLKEKVREMSEAKTEPDYYVFNGPKISLESYIETEVVCSLIDKMDEAPEPAKPVIPDFVADLLERCRNKGINLKGLLTEALENEKVRDWVIALKDKHTFETITRAWLDGYEVEKEKLYRVQIETVWLAKTKAGNVVEPVQFVDVDRYKYRLTEQEIKDYDERYWIFAVPVEEVPQ